MRTLNKKQRKTIDKIMQERAIKCVEDLTIEEYDNIETMNNHETLWQNIQRYIADKIISSLY